MPEALSLCCGVYSTCLTVSSPSLSVSVSFCFAVSIFCSVIDRFYAVTTVLSHAMIRFLIELLVHRTWFGRFDELYFILNWLVMRCKLRPELVADVQQTAWLKM